MGRNIDWCYFAAVVVDVSPHQLLVSSLLPVMEENLDVRFTTHCTWSTIYLYKSTYTDAEAGTKVKILTQKQCAGVEKIWSPLTVCVLSAFHSSTPTHFTCFTSTKVQITTLKLLLVSIADMQSVDSIFAVSFSLVYTLLALLVQRYKYWHLRSASIEDMESPDSIFAVSISLVYTFTFVPGMQVLLDALGTQWTPPQVSVFVLLHW